MHANLLPKYFSYLTGGYDVNLHHLYVFCAVASNKSFAKAANDINISQPAVSQQIQKLEQSLGKKLIERKGKLFKLTSHGETLFEYGKRIFEIAEEAENALSTMGQHQEKIFIGTSIIPGTYFLPDFIANFIEKKGHINFNVSLESTNVDLIEKIVKNQMDVAISYESIILRDDIQSKIVARDELVLALPGKHPWANGQLVSFEEVLTLPFIFFNHNFFIQQVLENILSGYRVNVVLQFSSLEMIKNAIMRGLGVSLLPYSSIKFELEHGQLAIANCNIFRVPRHIVLMYKRNNMMPNIVESFIKFLSNVGENDLLTSH